MTLAVVAHGVVASFAVYGQLAMYPIKITFDLSANVSCACELVTVHQTEFYLSFYPVRGAHKTNFRLIN